MIKFVILFLFLLLCNCQVHADYYGNGYNSGFNNNFRSKLNLNKPQITKATYKTHPRYNKMRHCNQCHNNYLSKGKLNTLERYALNKTYNRQSELQRLERLEDLAFGAIQSGGLNTRFHNVENAILSRPQYRSKQSILGNIANYFAGQATGFTPNLIQTPVYNNFGGFTSNPYAFTTAPGYMNNNFEQYSNGIFGGGWGFTGSDYGTGSSIKILD